MSKNQLGFLFFCFILACGGESSNSDDFNRQEEQLPEPEVLQRVYRADLKPVNPAVHNNVKGSAVLRLEDDSFEMNMAVQNVSSSQHPQRIHLLKSCPTVKDDTNKDGYIDLLEIEKPSGGVFIPLDGDLDNLGEEAQTYPNGGLLKAYVYREETSQSRLLSDLGAGSEFNISDRVIVVFGVDEDEDLPPTVATDTRPVQETLPIACGEFFRVIGPDL